MKMKPVYDCLGGVWPKNHRADDERCDCELCAAALGDGKRASTADVARLIVSLRWREDMRVVNDFDEHVWLGPCLDENGKRIGITDCCFVDDPCERHAAMVQ